METVCRLAHKRGMQGRLRSKKIIRLRDTAEHQNSIREKLTEEFLGNARLL